MKSRRGANALQEFGSGAADLASGITTYPFRLLRNSYRAGSAKAVRDYGVAPWRGVDPAAAPSSWNPLFRDAAKTPAQWAGRGLAVGTAGVGTAAAGVTAAPYLANKHLVEPILERHDALTPVDPEHPDDPREVRIPPRLVDDTRGHVNKYLADEGYRSAPGPEGKPQVPPTMMRGLRNEVDHYALEHGFAAPTEDGQHLQYQIPPHLVAQAKAQVGQMMNPFHQLAQSGVGQWWKNMQPWQRYAVGGGAAALGLGALTHSPWAAAAGGASALAGLTPEMLHYLASQPIPGDPGYSATPPAGQPPPQPKPQGEPAGLPPGAQGMAPGYRNEWDLQRRSATL